MDDHSTPRECAGVGEMKNKQCGACLIVSGAVTQVIPTETKGTLKPLRQKQWRQNIMLPSENSGFFHLAGGVAREKARLCHSLPQTF